MFRDFSATMQKLKKLAVVVTHPIQYYVPVFQQLAQYCNLRVFYTWGEDGAKTKYDPDFRKSIDWDLPLLEGYEYEFLINMSKKQGSHNYSGINNPNLVSSIEKFSPDFILIYGWAYQSHLSAIRYFKGKTPIWFRGDSHLMNSKPFWKKMVQKVLLTWVYHHIDQAFYVGKANKAYFKSFGLKEHQLTFAPHAIDNDRFGTNRSNEAQILRNELGIADNEILILFAGKLARKKSPEQLLLAFLELRMDHAHLLFVGNGELEESLKLKVESLKFKAESLKVNIHFMDFQNQSFMPVVYQACDLYCLSSQSETWGLAVNEAMACGKAILVSDKVGCAFDLVKPRENGNIYKSGDLSDFTSKLFNLVRDKTRLLEMGLQSKRIIKDWDFDTQIQQILKLIYAD